MRVPAHHHAYAFARVRAHVDAYAHAHAYARDYALVWSAYQRKAIQP